MGSCSTKLTQNETVIDQFFGDGWLGHHLFLGSTGQGKSTTLKHFILYEIMKRKYFKEVFVFSCADNDDYNWCNPKHVFDGFNIDIFKSLHKQLKAAKDQMKAQNKEMFHTAIILDDLLSDPGIASNMLYWRNFIAKCRHLCVSLFVCTQRLKDIVSNPVFRQNIRFAWLFQPSGKDNWNDAIDTFASGVPEIAKASLLV